MDCPRCGGLWYEDLDESGNPYTCFFCCNGTREIKQEDINEYDRSSDDPVSNSNCKNDF